jgi:hypothetical protein
MNRGRKLLVPGGPERGFSGEFCYLGSGRRGLPTRGIGTRLRPSRPVFRVGPVIGPRVHRELELVAGHRDPAQDLARGAFGIREMSPSVSSGNFSQLGRRVGCNNSTHRRSAP